MVGLGGALAITAAIGLARRWAEVPTLAVAYVVLVMYVGARSGRLPALTTAAMSFLVYEFFFVPPYGSPWISAPRDVVSLLALLAAAAVGERLVAALVARTGRAEASAREAGALYEVAAAALRDSQAEPALAAICGLAARDGGLAAMTIVACREDEVTVLAGAPLTPPEMDQVRTAAESGVALGARFHGGRLELFQQFPPAAAFVPLGAGVAVLRSAAPAPGDQRFVAALLGLAGLLLDRREAARAGRREEELAAADRVKSGILSSLSHELRSPLASLRAGLTTLTMPEARLPEPTVAIVQGLDRQAERLDRLVGDLLTLSRVEAGLPDDRAPLELSDLVGAVLGRMRAQLAAHQVSVDMPDELPVIEVDELQMERVVTNLLENAVEWTPAGGRIAVSGRAVEDGVELVVANDGPPIRAADLDSIFETFFTQRRGGLGLGLAMARRVAESHGGSLRADNRRSGPRFTLRLPAPAPATVR